MKKVGKITRPFRYDLNQIPYDYTVEVRNRFKGLDLIDRVPDEVWNEVHCTGDRYQDHLHEKERQKSKVAVWVCLTNSYEKKRREKQRRKERYKHLNAEFQRIARRDKVFLRINAKKQRKTTEWERLEISSKN